MTEAKSLVDVNVLVALADPVHQHHALALKWFDGGGGRSWGTCAFTDAGFLRVMTRPKFAALSVQQCTAILDQFTKHPGYRSWPVSTGWKALIAPFQHRVVGPQQVTDAYLLGLAIQENGVLVTLDRGLRFLAGTEYSQHLRLIEPIPVKK